MKLLVDVGNSRIKWGRDQTGCVVFGGAFATARSGLEGDLQRHWAGLDPPEGVYLVNVAGGEVERTILGWVRSVWGSPVRVVRSQRQAFGVINGYEQPELLGVDRWVGLIGLRADFALPACLVDAGTAITVDLLDPAGRHQGGLIAPGLRLMERALRTETHGVGSVHGADQIDWGRTTEAGVKSGVLQMALGLVERSRLSAQRLLGAEPALVLTGGDAKVLAARLPVPCTLARDLTLRGLSVIAAEGSR